MSKRFRSSCGKSDAFFLSMTVLLVDFRSGIFSTPSAASGRRQQSARRGAAAALEASDVAADADEDSAVHLENDAETGLAAQHTVVGFLCFLKRVDLVHRSDVVALTKLQCVLGIPSDSRIPALDRGALAEQIEGIDGQWADGADHYLHSVGQQH